MEKFLIISEDAFGLLANAASIAKELEGILLKNLGFENVITIIIEIIAIGIFIKIWLSY